MPLRDITTGPRATRNARGESRTNVDSSQPIVEQDVLIPWSSDPAASWVYFDCGIGVMLDSGIVTHNRLPQVDRTHDTLSSVDLAYPNLDKIIDAGVHLVSNDQYTDIVQRMGHSRYWFRLWGQALRVGYQIPIPAIKVIGGVPAIPHDKNPQWAYNRIVPGANYGGVPLYHAQWSLWYTTSKPPTRETEKELFVDPAAHINGAARLPNEIQVPFSDPDDNAVRNTPPPSIIPTVIRG